MASTIDYNQIAASVYQTVLSLNTTASELVGLNCIWCRLLPYDNGEDVIVQEYTLHQYDCPKQFKVITTQSDYQVGNFSIDLWGMHSLVPLEVSIDINTWKSIYGEGTMPLKGDFVLILMLHKAFEVKSSVVVYTIGELPTSYKCQLSDWKHTASRAESEEFTASIDELTDSQDRLFGEVISEEVADAVIEGETNGNVTTYVDPIKDFDMNSIVMKDLSGLNGNIYAHAYYDFTQASKCNTYNIESIYNPSNKENHWIYTCWFKIPDSDNIEKGSLKIIDLYIKERYYWYFTIQSGIKIAEGDEVTINRGGVIKLTGTIESKECETGFVIKIPTSDCLKASATVKNWWENGVWKIQKAIDYNLFTGYDNGITTMAIKLDTDNIHLSFGDSSKTISLTKTKALDFSFWHYLVVDMSASSVRVLMVKNKFNEATNKYTNKNIVDQTELINIQTFKFDTCTIGAKENNMYISKIRLYESEYPMDDNYKLDMYSEVTRNASKLMLVDNPTMDKDTTFITKVR